MSPAWPTLSVIGGVHSEMPLTPASQRKIQRIVEKNAARGGRAAVIKYVQRFSKGKPGRPSHGADKASWWEVKQLIYGKSLSERKACRLLAEGLVRRGAAQCTVEQLEEKLRRNYRTVEQSLKNILG